MKNTLVLAKKDLLSYFYSWTGVIVLVFFAIVSGVFFCIPVLSFAKLSMSASQQNYQALEGLGMTRYVFSSYFTNIGTILIFIVPFLGMRAFAEEKSQQTLELLFTYPFSDISIVLGKFFGMIGFFLILMMPTLLFIPVLHGLGGDLEAGPIISGYCGFILLGIAYLALGLFVSAVAENQVVSAIVTFSCLVIFWVFEWITGLSDGRLAHFFSALSPLDHYRVFPLGILDLAHILYFVFFCFYFLFLTMRAVETRQWKG